MPAAEVAHHPAGVVEHLDCGTAGATGYLPAEVEVALTAGRTVNVELALTREVTTGSIAGHVTDPVSGVPLPAADDDANYRFDNLAPGACTIEASAPSYLTATAKTRVSVLVEQRADFQLVKTGVKISLKVYFDTDKAELRTESHQALADAAKTMDENPGIKVEIHGRTDNIGSTGHNRKLSQRCAQAVVDTWPGWASLRPD